MPVNGISTKMQISSAVWLGVAQSVMQHCMAAQRELHNFALRDQRPQQDSNNADHGISHPAQDQAIHRQPKIDSFKSAKKRRRLSAIAHLCSSTSVSTSARRQ